MRAQDNKGIRILESEVRPPKDIDFDALEADITLLAHQPGIGKTHSVIKHMKKKRNANTCYFTDRHSTLNEIVERSSSKNVVFTHWEGFDRVCPIAKYGKLGHVSRKLICRQCSSKKCKKRSGKEYLAQFKSKERVLAPYEYLKTTYVAQPKPPKVVFLDENKVKVDTLSFDKEAFAQWLKAADMDTTYVSALENGDYGFFDSINWKILQRRYAAYSEQLLADGDHDGLKQLSAANPYMLEDYFRWAAIYDDYEKEYYVPLYYYAFDLLREGVPLVFLDATFDKKFFYYMLEAYNGEIGFESNVTVKVYRSDKKRKSTKVYTVQNGYHPETSFAHYWASMKKWVLEDLERIKDIFGADNVGVIGHRKLFGDAIEVHLRDPQTKPEEAEEKTKERRYERNNYKGLYMPLLETEYFGNLRSSNRLEDKKVLVILGTYSISLDAARDVAKKLFDLSDEEVMRIKTEAEELAECYERGGEQMIDAWNVEEFAPDLAEKWREGAEFAHDYRKKRIAPPYGERRLFGRFSIFGGIDKEQQKSKGPKPLPRYYMSVAQTIQRLIWGSERYQAYHRNRGLLYDRIIISYGVVPQQIYNEFDVKELPNRRPLKKQFNEWEQHEKADAMMRGLTKDLANGLSNTKIANKYRIWRTDGKRGPDSRAVKALRKQYERIRKQINEH